MAAYVRGMPCATEAPCCYVPRLNPSAIPPTGASTTAYTIRTSTAVNKCVDVPNAQVTTNGVGLWQWDCNGTPAQSFYLVPSGAWVSFTPHAHSAWSLPPGLHAVLCQTPDARAQPPRFLSDAARQALTCQVLTW